MTSMILIDKVYEIYEVPEIENDIYYKLKEFGIDDLDEKEFRIIVEIIEED